MNNVKGKQIKRYQVAICRMASEMEEHQIPYTGLLSRVLTRKELEGVLRFVGNHTLYPEIEENWEE